MIFSQYQKTTYISVLLSECKKKSETIFSKLTDYENSGCTSPIIKQVKSLCIFYSQYIHPIYSPPDSLLTNNINFQFSSSFFIFLYKMNPKHNMVASWNCSNSFKVMHLIYWYLCDLNVIRSTPCYEYCESFVFAQIIVWIN